jgi:uncharacterized protein (TIGR00369 family)
MAAAEKAPAMPTATVFDRFPKPPCAVLLGWQLLDFDAEKGSAKLSFEARPEFLNPAGFVQGGMLTAMLDDAMGPAVLLMSGGALYTTTINMNVSFLAPARPGTLFADSQVVQLGKSIGFVEARLRDADGVLLAQATASVRLVPASKLPQ